MHNSCDELNNENDVCRWSVLPSLQQRRAGCSALVFRDEMLYVMGGHESPTGDGDCSALDTMELLDMRGGSSSSSSSTTVGVGEWQMLPSRMQRARSDFGAAVCCFQL